MYSNFITLIPKVQVANEFVKFRLIALANFIFKLIPMIIANRLSILLPTLISPQQTNFIKGGHIHGFICIVSKGMNMLSRLRPKD